MNIGVSKMITCFGIFILDNPVGNSEINWASMNYSHSAKEEAAF